MDKLAVVGDAIIGRPWNVGIALVALVATACGTATPTAPTSNTTAAHAFPQMIMILEGRPVPEELTVAAGERVSFMNHDRTTYTIGGSREPSRPDCPEVNGVGVLTSGDTRTSEAFTTAKICDFHVLRDASAPVTGRIIIR